jgi:SAM-dependent methyltransferase
VNVEKFSELQLRATEGLFKNTYWPRGGYFNLNSARQFMIEMLRYIQPDGSLLDLGCSKLIPYKAFVESCGMRWFGADLYDAKDIASPDYRQSGEASIPFDNEQFNIIMSFHVIEHFTHPEAMFAEMNRCLKSGGIIGGACAFHEFEHRSFFHLTSKGIASILKRHGFEILSIAPSNHSGWMVEGQRFFGGTGSINKSSRKEFLRTGILCNLNWGPFLFCNTCEFLRRNMPFLRRYYRPSQDAATIYFYARKR